MIRRLKNLIRRGVFHFIKPPVEIRYNSYSQAGEDMIIDFLLRQISGVNPSYLELGVYHASNLSNTFKFYQNGSTGVLVEADTTLIDAIKLERPKDIILNVGVGLDSDTKADFFIFDNQGLNTFDKKEAMERERTGINKIRKTVSVTLKTVNSIIAGNFTTYPDLLSIDIEGLDLAVLQSLDFTKYPIPVICAETCMYSENHIKDKDRSIEQFLVTKDYFVYADTYINTIFVNKTWFYKTR